MPIYYDFTKKFLFLLGFDFDQHSRHRTLLLIMKCFILFFLFISTIQSFLFFIKDESKSFQNMSSLTMMMFGIQGFMKQFAIVRKQKVIVTLLNRLKILKSNLTAIETQKSSVFLMMIKNICINMLAMLMICTVMFNFIEIAKIIFVYSIYGELNRKLPYGIWWPFNPLDYFAPMYLYYMFWAHLMIFAPTIIDQFLFLMLSEVITHFERVGDQVENVINNAGNKSFAETRNEFRKCIEKHNELITLCNILNEIYDIPLLAQVISSSISIATVGFMIVVYI